ncbi:MAG: hypothetical protein IPJ06_00710 [Saprospiraceae bacterium]|nr:hypothetical protein [Saprospiraceae bacterium]
MHMYPIEETKKSICCPFCHEAEKECLHLLAVIDRSNGCCDWGALFERWEEFRNLLVEAFGPLLQTKSRPPKYWKQHSDLHNAREASVYLYSSSDPDRIPVDSLILTTMVSELLSECGSDCFYGAQLEEVQPGQDWVIDIHYAEFPEETMDKALTLLRNRLDLSTTNA